MRTNIVPTKIVTTRGVKTLRDVTEVAGLGYVQCGLHRNPHTREELQGMPVFRGLVGPMWDGGALRYEDEQTHRDLST